MKKRLFFLLVIFVIISCNRKGKDVLANADEPETEVSQIKPVPEIYQTPEREVLMTDSVPDMVALEGELEKFRRLSPTGLSFSMDELVKIETEWSQKTLPAKFDTPAIKSRIIVLRTLLLQSKTLIAENASADTLNLQQIQIVNAYNALKKQMEEALRNKAYDEFLENADTLDINKEFEKPDDQ